ncbi:MAG: sigma 54-interacting transcriptional regulator [Firmicutes bacterium]|nr:sigma 54-interacting transcriptional regulator [Bacillota bacterium]
MKKKVAVITFWGSVAEHHCQQLENLFQGEIELEAYSFDSGNINQDIDADVVVISMYSTYVAVKKYLSKDSKIVIITPTITVEQFERINSIAEGKKVMVVNYSSEMTMETIALFNQIGLKHLELIPVYPGVKNIPDIDIAVTPGEPQHVPDRVKTVIDVGHRVLDTRTIVDILLKLDMAELLKSEIFLHEFERLKSYSSVKTLLGKTNSLENEFDSLLNVLDHGIIAIDHNGIIHSFNKRAQEILDIEMDNAIGKTFERVVPEIPFNQVIEYEKAIEGKLLKINNKNISATVVPVITMKKVTAVLAMINNFTEEEHLQHKLRAQLLGKGHKAKYRFSNIIGDSEAMKNLRKIAQKMAKSDSSVLIMGESGTGKELFAQAMHNESKRNDYQFVAVNCAALPESLLESELFGYEEGAFTGARKGGKPGLFELAHKGTLFLDEIGEMALGLQSRLLRVIQEREVMRIGSDQVINIDIRLIAATNKNLKVLVKEGKFRQDLYYRLNVLPLRTIPLRDRRDDIPEIIENIKDELKLKFKFSNESLCHLKKLKWEGNVRELRNYVEYLAYLDKDIIYPEDMPFLDEEYDEDDFDEYIDEEEEFVLKELYTSYKEKSRIGRRSISKRAEENGYFISENEVRKILKTLESKSYVKLSNGRGGTKITQKGISLINTI